MLGSPVLRCAVLSGIVALHGIASGYVLCCVVLCCCARYSIALCGTELCCDLFCGAVLLSIVLYCVVFGRDCTWCFFLHDEACRRGQLFGIAGADQAAVQVLYTGCRRDSQELCKNWGPLFPL